jgi:hypothetical protein
MTIALYGLVCLPPPRPIISSTSFFQNLHKHAKINEIYQAQKIHLSSDQSPLMHGNPCIHHQLES